MSEKPVYKIVRMVKKCKDLTLEQFRKYWLEQHNQFEKDIVKTGLFSRVVVSFATGDVLIWDDGVGRFVSTGMERPWDGMMELYFNKLDDVKAKLQNTFSGKLIEDERKFMDLSEDQAYVVTEEYLQNVQSDLLIQRPMIKSVRIIMRRKDFTLDQFKEYYREQHRKLEKVVARTGPLKKQVATIATGETFVQSAATGRIVLSDKEPPWDSTGQLYFNNFKDMNDRLTGPFPGKMREDEKNFIDLQRDKPRLAAEEYEMA